MKYTIDVGFLETKYRLKNDSTFREFKGKFSKELEDDDEVFLDYNEAKNYAKSLESIEVDGEVIQVNTGKLGNYTISAKPHRVSKPKKHFITRQELKEVLVNGDDSRNNSLILDMDGYLKLIPFSEWRSTPYAVRYETFGANNGYVGINSNLSHLELTYLTMIDGWVNHLNSHEQIYKDYVGKVDEEKLLKEIEELIEEI